MIFVFIIVILKKKKIDDGKIPKNFQIDNWQQNAVVN